MEKKEKTVRMDKVPSNYRFLFAVLHKYFEELYEEVGEVKSENNEENLSSVEDKTKIMMEEP